LPRSQVKICFHLQLSLPVSGKNKLPGIGSQPQWILWLCKEAGRRNKTGRSDYSDQRGTPAITVYIWQPADYAQVTSKWCDNREVPGKTVNAAGRNQCQEATHIQGYNPKQTPLSCGSEYH